MVLTTEYGSYSIVGLWESTQLEDAGADACQDNKLSNFF